MENFSKEETGQDFAVGKKKLQDLPSVQWFSDNNTPIKNLSLCTKDLESIPEEDKDIVALSTQAVAGRRLTLMIALLSALCLLVVLEIICVALYIHSQVVWNTLGNWIAWSDWTVTVVIAALAGAVILIGAFSAPWCYKVIKGFLLINGAERLGVSHRYQLALNIFCRLSYVWGIILLSVQSLVQKKKSGKSEISVQVAIPEHCGYDDLINRYGRKNKTAKIPAPIKEETDGQKDVKKAELKDICAKVRAGEAWRTAYAERRGALYHVRKASDLYPGVKWFKKNGTRIKEIGLPYEVIESMSEAELDMVSVSTFALVERRMRLINYFLIMLGIFLLLTIIGIIVMTCADYVIGLELLVTGVFFFLGNLLTGSVCMLPCYRIFTAFLYINGDKRLMLDYINYSRKVKIYEKISYVWGFVLLLVLAFAGGLKYVDAKYVPHVGMPENCGFDNLINLSEKREQVEIDALINALQEKSNEHTHEQYLKNLDKIKDEIKSDKNLIKEDKEKLYSKIQENKEKEKKKYDEAQSSLTEFYEQEIKPEYDSLWQEMVESIEPILPATSHEVDAINAQVSEFVSYDGRKRVGKELAEKRINAVNICLAVAAALSLIAGIIAFFVTYHNWTFWSDWGFVLIPLLFACAFAVAGIVVYIKTDSSTFFKLTSVVTAALFVCCLLMVSIMAIYENAVAEVDQPWVGNGDSGWGGGYGYSGLSVGETAPDFTLEVYDGNGLNGVTYALENSLKAGRVVVFYFWATTAIPTVTNLEYFNRLRQTYGNEVDVVAIHSEYIVQDVQDFINTSPVRTEDWKEYGIIFAQDSKAIEYNGQMHTAFEAFGGQYAYPVTAIISASGIFTYSWLGTIPYEILEEAFLEAKNS